MNKRGLSTIITTLIMILLVLVATGVVWVVISNVLKSSVEDIDIGKFTISLSIEDVKINDNSIDVKIKRNPGAGEISGLKFAVSNGINTSIFEETTTINELEEKTYVLNYDGGLVKSVSIAPILKTSSGKEKTGNIVVEKEFSNKEIIQNLGAVSWWRFEGNANDEIGNNHGTLTNGVDCNNNGKYGKACSFDGVDDYINVGSDTSLDDINVKTIVMWAKPKDNLFGYYPALISKTPSGANSGWNLIISEDSDRSLTYWQERDIDSGKWNTLGTLIYEDNWYHIAIVYNRTLDSNDPIIFVNGTFQSIDEWISAPSGNAVSESFYDLWIGANPSSVNSGGLNTYNGTIDEVMIFNRALSADEVKELYELDLDM